MDFDRQRSEMVRKQLRPRGIVDARVLEAMGEVPRHLFVPRTWRRDSYADTPLPLGPEQTISQPYIVALMAERAELRQGDRALEIGTGSGYQAAVLAEMGASVFSVELDERLSGKAARRLAKAGYPDVALRGGDGRLGWPEAAPFDAILVTAAPASVPEALVDQLADGGRMVIPVGTQTQELLLIRKEGEDTREERIIPVRFVPLR